MLPRLLLVASLLQAALIYLPLPTWWVWMAHFAALEGCLLGVATGLGALALGDGPYVRGLAILGIVAGLLPALAVVPAYLREGQRFSPLAWLTGGPTPDVSVTHDLALAPGLVADVYAAPGAAPHPWVMVVHGGSWRSGDKGDAAHVSRVLAGAGYTVLDVRYRLAPEAPFPGAIQDVKCLLAQVQARAAELGVDPTRGALLGRSAGGQIALVAAYSDDRIAPACGGPPATVRAVVSIYGPVDLAWGHDHPYVPDVVQGTDAVETYLGGPPSQRPDAYAQANPVSWVSDTSPPTLLIHGTAERCVSPRHMQWLAEALTRRGRKVHAVPVPFADHGFDVRPGGFGEQLARGVILQFLRENV